MECQMALSMRASTQPEVAVFLKEMPRSLALNADGKVALWTLFAFYVSINFNLI
jgi:hypothetical protein